MKSIRLWGALVLVLALVAGGWWAVWNYELRWRPRTIVRHQAEIARLLETSGWVSAGAKGPRLYMVSFRSCTDCVRFKTEVAPQLLAEGVDLRVIVVARRDRNGLSRSSPAERATVAELWINRSGPLMKRWDSTPPDAWTAPGVPAADGDAARTAVVEAGRDMTERLTPLLKANGIDFAYPLLVWWNQDGEMRGCACESSRTYRFVRRELRG